VSALVIFAGWYELEYGVAVRLGDEVLYRESATGAGHGRGRDREGGVH
jgi:hypothetical protein